MKKRKQLFLVLPAVGFILGVHAAAFLKLVWQQSFVIEGTRYFWLGDDAMISMRYAHNLAQGHGLVWNVGEYVQGITNLGWTLVMTLVHLAGYPLAVNPLIIQTINLCLNLGIITLVFLHLYRRVGPFVAVSAALLLALDGSLFVLSLGGFETSLQALLITLAFLRLVPISFKQDQRLFSNFYIVPLLCALAFIVRPDSIVFLGLAVLVVLWLYFVIKNKDKRIWLVIPVSIAIVGVVLVFQRAYYGDWLPNTFQLKATRGASSLIRGVDYLHNFSFREFYHLPLLLGSTLFIGQGLYQRNKQTWINYVPVALLFFGWIIYVVSIGGDAFAHGRFFVAIIPLMAVLTTLYLAAAFFKISAFLDSVRYSRLINVPNRRITAHFAIFQTLIALVLLFLLFKHISAFQSFVTSNVKPSTHAVEGVSIALALRRAQLPQDSLIAVYFAGTTPYFMPKYRFHDLLGKSDKHIANSPAHPGLPGHNKWDYRYSLDGLKPALIITAGPYRNASDQAFAKVLSAGTDYGFGPALWIDNTFREKYRRNRVYLTIDDQIINDQHWVYAGEKAERGNLTLVGDFALNIDQIRLPNSPPILVIEPLLQGSVGVDPLSAVMPQQLEIIDDRIWLWLNSDDPQPVAGTLWADTNRQVLLEFEVSPSPLSLGSYPSQVQLTISYVDGETVTFEKTVKNSTILTFPVHLQKGPNYLRFKTNRSTSVASQSEEKISPAVVLHQIRIGEPSKTDLRSVQFEE